jgi:RNA polymerase sigma-70 factor (ECF subfamily)
VTRFLAACEEGAVAPFLELLTEDALLTGDSGGNVPRGVSIARPVAGRDAVARVLAGFVRRGAPVHFERALVGGEPGLLIVADDAIGGGLIGTWSFEVVDGQLAAIRGVINPEKLRHLGPLADLERLREWLRGPGRRREAR